MLDDRKARILRILVEEYIRTGEPVSSRAVLECCNLGVSPATVRSELAALEAEGYAAQPHTSAGRTPTARAYRYYVDQLMRPNSFPNASARVAEFFTSVHSELGRLLKATTGLLSEITHYPSVVTGPGLSSEVVRAIHLVQTGVDGIVMVVVTQSGRVSQSLLSFPFPLDAADVEEAELMLRQGQIGHAMSRGLEPDRPRSDDVVAGAESIVWRASEVLRKAGNAERELYLGPASYLAGAWGEISKVRGVLKVLEREAALLEVLAHLPEGTEVRIGRELGIESPRDISLVSTTYGGEHGGPPGRIGVIGPMRMDYGRTISVVEQVSGGLDESLGGG